MVVLGAEKEAVRLNIKKLPVKHCYNENLQKGMLSSVKCGFR